MKKEMFGLYHLNPRNSQDGEEKKLARTNYE